MQGGGPPRPMGPPQQARTPWLGEPQAYEWLAQAEALHEDEEFNERRAVKRDYSRRWVAWAGANPDEAASIILEAQTVASITPPPKTDSSPPTRPRVAAQVKALLVAALDRGDSKADLALLVAELGGETGLGSGAMAGVLRAIQEERDAEARLEEEAARLAEAVDRQEIGSALITLEGLFPPSLAAAIRIRTSQLPTDDVASAGVFLAAAAGAMRLGSEVVASRAAGFRVPLNLYGGLVGRSGSKKGPLWKLLLCEPLKPIEIELSRQNKAAEESWKTENKGKKPYERTDPPAKLHLTTKEFTGEALDHQLQIQERAGLGLMINRDELKGVFGSLNAYRGGRGGDSEQLLEAYDGSGSSSLRVGADGGGRFYDRCHLSIFGTIQPDVLQALVADGDASGLWARFLFIPLPERVVPLAASETEEEALAAESSSELLAGVIRRLHQMPRLSLALTQAARELFVAYEARCQGDALQASIAAQGAAWGKAPGKVLRLAGLLHLLQRVSPDGARHDLVAADTIQQAANLIDHLTGWTLGLHQAAQSGGESSDLMHCLHRAAQAAGRPIGWQQLSRRLGRKQRQQVDSATAQGAAVALSKLGVGEQAVGPRGAWTYRATRDLTG